MVDAQQLAARIPRKAIREYDKALAEVKKGRIQPAIQHLEQAIAIAPQYYNAHKALGDLYNKSERFGEAKQEFLAAVKLNESDGEPLIALGGIAIRERRWKEAAEILERAVRLTPGSAIGAYYLGSALFKLSEFERAEESLRRARFIDERFVPARLMLISVYLRQSRLEEALDEVNACLKESPEPAQREELEKLRVRLLQNIGG